MKLILDNLYWEIVQHLNNLKLGNMTLKDRLEYERAKVKLEMLKTLMNKSDIKFND